MGRLTLSLFYRLYQHYKDDFDNEMRMQKANVTYAEAYARAQKSEEWL